MIKSYQFSDPIASNYGKLYDIAIKNFNKPINEKTMPFSFGGDDKSHGNPIGIFRQGLCFNDRQEPYFAKAEAVKLYKLTCKGKSFTCLLVHDKFYYSYVVEGEIHFWKSNTNFTLNGYICQCIHEGKPLNSSIYIDVDKLTDTILVMMKERVESKSFQMRKQKITIELLPDSEAIKYLNHPMVDVDGAIEDRFISLKKHLNW
jgi:hypothetical protein